MSDVIMIAVSLEMLGGLDEWSPPIQVRIEKIGDAYEMIARRHDCPVDNLVDNAPDQGEQPLGNRGAFGV